MSLDAGSLKREEQREVLIQEIDVNLQEQLLLTKRIETMKEYMQDFPRYDPTYFSLDKQILIDRLQLDELLKKEDDLILRLKCLGPD